MKIGAVIVTYNNTPEELAACRQSVKENHIESIKVIDNTPPNHNWGFAVAANKGAKASQGDYILFLNPDAVLTKGSIARAFEHMETHNQAAVVGLSLQAADGSREFEAWGEDVTLATLIKRKFTRPPYPVKVKRVDWVSGGAMLVRKTAFDEVGGFDEQFFLYWEDVDLCRRLRNMGWDIYFMPEAKVIHTRGASHTDIAEKTHQYDMSADRYFRKHYSKGIWKASKLARTLYRLFSPQVR